jgi:hypothetical protein
VRKATAAKAGTRVAHVDDIGDSVQPRCAGGIKILGHRRAVNEGARYLWPSRDFLCPACELGIRVVGQGERTAVEQATQAGKTRRSRLQGNEAALAADLAQRVRELPIARVVDEATEMDAVVLREMGQKIP